MNNNSEIKNKKNQAKKSSEKLIESKTKLQKDGTQYNLFKIVLKILF